MTAPGGHPADPRRGGCDPALADLIARIPFAAFLDLTFDEAGGELVAHLPYRPRLIGNPQPPALHGGATAAFLEITAVVGLGRQLLRDARAQGAPRPDQNAGLHPGLPKTIDLTIDYLRPGRLQDAYAVARVNRSGRRYASVHVEGWQEDRARPFAQATGHFLMPERRGGTP